MFIEQLAVKKWVDIKIWKQSDPSEAFITTKLHKNKT
jgi:hypothetical protein